MDMEMDGMDKREGEFDGFLNSKQHISKNSLLRSIFQQSTRKKKRKNCHHTRYN